MSVVSVLVGSIRTGRQGLKVANYVAKQLEKRGHKVHIIDPLVYPSLNQFQERFRFIQNPNEDLVQVQKMLDESDSFIGVTPEYNYAASPAILQTMDVFFNEFKFKPMGIVGYLRIFLCDLFSLDIRWVLLLVFVLSSP